MEKPNAGPRRRAAPRSRASPGTRASSCGAVGRSGRPWSATRRCSRSSARSAHSELALPAAYEQLRPVSIDYAVMEAAAQAGRVVMGTMNVGWSDLGGWTALLEMLDVGGSGRVVPPGETVAPERRRPAHRAALRPPRRRRWPTRLASSTATPTALLAGAAADRADRRCADRARDRSGEPVMTNIAEAPTPTHIVFGTDGWRARVADEYTFENVRRCADGVARLRRRAGRAGEGRGHRLRPPVRLGALRGRRRRGPPRPRHPGRLRQPRGADPDELATRSSSGVPRPASSSPPATTRGPTTGSR